ncbi:MAG: hypothetical protein KDJ87_05430 [Rhizobiaceae bacterium]|nr:hypothetical protein [Rhizobiaceae bacterium]
MTKIILTTTAAVIATLSFATASEAGWRHHNRFGHFNVVIDTGPSYVVDDGYGYDEPDCYVRKVKKINRYGELVIKKIQVCD